MKFVLEKKDGTEEYLYFILKHIKEAESIVIFGAGKGGATLYEIIQKENCIEKLMTFSDNNVGKIGKKYLGFPTCEPSKLQQGFPEATIFVASTAWLQIKEQLLSMGYTKDKIIYTQLAGLSLSKKNSDKEFTYKYFREFKRAYQLLEDDKSRHIFLNLLNYRITKEIQYLEKLSSYIDDEKDQYFDRELVEFYDKDVFVDCGSYVGDTIENLLEFTNKKIEIIAFEADKIIFRRLEDKCREYRWNCKCYNLGVWSEKAELHFDTTCIENGGGNICAEGEEVIYADKLDNIIGERKVKYIKMDIEGAEQNALQGAMNLINNNRPILGICVYHRPDDLYRIPLFISGLNLNYAFYFRQYRFGQSETVCYAVPQ